MITEIEAQKLEIFNEDEIMRQAVEKVLYSVCDLNELHEAKDSYSNAQLGQILRAYKSARKLLAIGFQQVDKFKREKQETPKQIPEGL